MLIHLLLFTCNYEVSVRMGFLFLLVLGMGCVILLLHPLGLPYNYFGTLLAKASVCRGIFSSFLSLVGLRLYVPVIIFQSCRNGPPLPGYYQYFLGGKCILLKDTTRRTE